MPAKREKHYGEVITFDPDKRCGFLKKDTGGEFFFHLDDCYDVNDVLVGDFGIFEENKGRRRAVHIEFRSHKFDDDIEYWGEM